MIGKITTQLFDTVGLNRRVRQVGNLRLTDYCKGEIVCGQQRNILMKGFVATNIPGQHC